MLDNIPDRFGTAILGAVFAVVGFLAKWLWDTYFKSGIAPLTRSRELAEELFALEIHLVLWHAKFKVWIPDHPEHALVYMEDEFKHGLGFPNERVKTVAGVVFKMPGVDQAVLKALDELRGKWGK